MSQNETGKRPHHPRAPPSFPPPSCPRCSSGNTKFCYYNNYSVSQPRYICKNCRRYWTHGGVVRNIPINRKRSRAESMSSSSLPMTKPSPTGILEPQPTLAWSMGFPENPGGAGAGSSVGCVRFGCGGFFNQTSFGFSQGSVNTAFGGVNVGFGGGARPPPAPSTPVFSHHSCLDGFGRSFIQQPQFQPPPTYPVALNNLGNTLTSNTNLLPVARDPNAAANVVSIKEWPELDDMDSEGDPLQTYKPSIP